MIQAPTDFDAAFEAWGANCGPLALAALTGCPLDRIHEALGGRSWRGWTNVGHMKAALLALGVRFTWRRPHRYDVQAIRGAVFVQWLDPRGRADWGHWRQAHQNTHWIAVEDGDVVDTLTEYATGQPPVEYLQWVEMLDAAGWAPNGFVLRSFLEVPLSTPTCHPERERRIWAGGGSGQLKLFRSVCEIAQTGSVA